MSRASGTNRIRGGNVQMKLSSTVFGSPCLAMWAIKNQTRFKADRAFARDADGAEIWLVAVRATFRFTADGEVALADEQQDVCLAPKSFGEPGKSSLRYDTDLVRTKSGRDVSAARVGLCSPRSTGALRGRVVAGGPAVQGVAGFRRPHLAGRTLWSDTRPARSVYENTRPLRAGPGRVPLTAPTLPAIRPIPSASGGWPSPAARCPTANIPNSRFVRPRLRPLSQASVPFHATGSRAKLAGTYDDAWKKQRQPLVPADFQDAHFRCACRSAG